MSNIIDLTYLKEISGGDTSFIKEMLELYVNTTATEAVLFRELYEKRDLSGIGHLAHKMKAPIQMLGANELYNLIRTLETIGKEGVDSPEIPGIIDRVNQNVTESIDEVNNLLATF